jgi:hypothetical protein
MVYVRKGGQLSPLEQPYSGPYRVLERGPKFFRLDIGGKQTAVSVERLKPHPGTAAATPAAPPQRGHPPAARAQLAIAPAPSPLSPSLGLPATVEARPAWLRKPPSRLVLG